VENQNKITESNAAMTNDITVETKSDFDRSTKSGAF